MFICELMQHIVCKYMIQIIFHTGQCRILVLISLDNNLGSFFVILDSLSVRLFLCTNQSILILILGNETYNFLF